MYIVLLNISYNNIWEYFPVLKAIVSQLKGAIMFIIYQCYTDLINQTSACQHILLCLIFTLLLNCYTVWIRVGFFCENAIILCQSWYILQFFYFFIFFVIMSTAELWNFWLLCHFNDCKIWVIIIILIKSKKTWLQWNFYHLHLDMQYFCEFTHKIRINRCFSKTTDI